ncbi:ABC transporter ATP-binding protein [Corynebacterium cystitidis]|uniref:ABC transporter ATP-binding protein n=2 Tax=Corynebacterium cystitidis TaxID=35757 RepID=UPI00211DCECD|nr:ATP-binding cassette domain-containing protein [Corynebacterium cystitidis]
MIEFMNIHKRYGDNAVLDDVSFKAESGAITGLVGPNGAGKSTLIRILLGLESADQGTALISNVPYRDLGIYPFATVGSFIDDVQPHPSRTGLDQLRWVGLATGVDRKRCEECLDLVGLRHAAKQRIKIYSLGMKQRLGLATAILAEPKCLVLDEPINGLDPDGIRWVRDFLKQFTASGGTVLLSSHYMSELEQTADHIVALRSGRIVIDGSTQRIVEKWGTLENAFFNASGKGQE